MRRRAEDDPARTTTRRRRAVVHHRGGDPRTSARRDQRRHATATACASRRSICRIAKWSMRCSDAADRGVRVRLILDPNRDAFGRQKDGVPNRPVANELVTQSGETDRGALVSHARRAVPHQDRADHAAATASSRRSARRTSLAATSAITTSKRTSRWKRAADSPLAIEMMGYFDRLWNNDGPPGTEYTAPFGAYRDDGSADATGAID